MDKITEADMLRKDIAETDTLSDTLEEKIEERVRFETSMLNGNFNDDIKKRTSKYGVTIQNAFRETFDDAKK